MKNKLLLLLILVFFAGCSIFKPGTNVTDKKITSFSFNYPPDKVTATLLSVIESEGYQITQNNINSGEIITDTKKIRESDDVYTSLKSISDLPSAPLSQYTGAAYYLFIKIEQDKNKTKVSIKNNIEAMERGQFNRIIKLESNGGKEKELLSKILKVLK